MAGYACGGCDGAEPAAILITPLNGAETLAIGENCMPVTWCGILAGVLGLEAEQLWDAAVALKQAVIDMEAQTQADTEAAADSAEAAAGGPSGDPATPPAAEPADSKPARTKSQPARTPTSRRRTS